MKSRNKKIYLIETKCEHGNLEVNCRQACTVESAANTNPNATIYFLFLNPLPASSTSSILLQLLRRNYQQILIRRVDLKEYLENTPLDQKWLKSSHFNTAPWPVVEVSNVLRVLTLWKYGGIYLDLDFVMIK